MSIITLTTDFGTKDYLVASIKGAILSDLPSAKIVDISHEISPFDLAEASFVLKNAYKNFPEGAVHIVGIDDLIKPGNLPIASEIDGHFFVCADNGILSLISSDYKPKEIVRINIPQAKNKTVFPTRDIFVPVACHLARGGKLSVIGAKTKEIKELFWLRPAVKDNKEIVGSVIYIDNFGNVITNISRKLLEKIRRKRNVRVRFRNHEFTEIHDNYSDVVKNFDDEDKYMGAGLALFGSSDYLEMAIYKSNPQTVGGANTLLGLKKGDEIIVEFD